MTSRSDAAPADLTAEIGRLHAALDAASRKAEADRVAAEAEQARLTFELGHRVKNTLSVVQALAAQTMRGAGTKEEALEVFGKRVMALSRANDVILNQSWTTASIRSVAESVLAPFDLGHNRLDIVGPDTRINASSALSFGMALNELALNAQRFGAWSVEGGRVSLDWHVEPAAEVSLLVLSWREIGGPAVAPPAKRGFGLKLVEQSLKSAFGRDVDLQFPSEGVTCLVRSAMAKPAS